ncbi:LOW QUALITY PROTEIN: gametocyte-specific factor 1 [Strix aluco]|uniref:LOW QUALITY PROTEIN: gametocyte-specific factor 1 n=1 Tax=Strix aluco TaxID=111821 RepID=UPI003DA26B2E
MDPEALVQCPYDKSHQVRASRLPYHIVKCQRNHPQVARMLATCPFNARHRVPQANLRSHIASCPDKRLSDLPHEMDMSLGNRMKQPEIPTAWQSPPCQEDWEAELEDLEDPPPFIFNIGMNDLLLPCDSFAPAAPTSRSRGGEAAGQPVVGSERWAQTVAAAPGRCLSLSQDQQNHSARGAVSPRPLLWGAIVPTNFKCMLQISCLRTSRGRGGPHGAPATPGSPRTRRRRRIRGEQFHVCYEPCQQRPCNTCRSFCSEGGSSRR